MQLGQEEDVLVSEEEELLAELLDESSSFAQEMTVRLETVSYTHLTLPTICSV